MLKREGRKEGHSKGLTEGKISIIRFQFLTKHKTPELIAEDLGLPLEFVQKLCDLLVTHPKKSDGRTGGSVIRFQYHFKGHDCKKSCLFEFVYNLMNKRAL